MGGKMKNLNSEFIKNIKSLFTIDELAQLISEEMCVLCIKRIEKDWCSGDCTERDCAEHIRKYYEELLNRWDNE